MYIGIYIISFSTRGRLLDNEVATSRRPPFETGLFAGATGKMAFGTSRVTP